MCVYESVCFVCVSVSVSKLQLVVVSLYMFIIAK